MKAFRLVGVALLVGAGGCASVKPIENVERQAVRSSAPRAALCRRAGTHIEIDGRIDGREWSRAEPLRPFTDIRGPDHPPPRRRTQVLMLWDDRALYIAATLEEPHVWAEFTRRDDVVWHENDFEVFIDPDGDGVNYYELEINARNTVFDLLIEKPYREGGSARHDWNIAGLRSAVYVDGTLNDPSDEDRAWQIELAIPWTALSKYATVPSPPRAGDVWRMNFSRVQWDVTIVDGAYRKVEDRREHNWVWSPQGEIDMHIPQRWGYVTFTR